MLYNLFKNWGIQSLPLLTMISVICYSYGLYSALISSPTDSLQGEYVRIMYIHVPAAWLSLAIYSFMAVNSAIAMVYNNRIADFYAYAAAPIGLCFAMICLLSGSLWGQPIWGTWWVWDSRLTSMLILFLLYCGYMLIWDYDVRSSRAAAILNIVGFINIPTIKYSVQLWNTMHQPASITLKNIAIDTSMLIPLIIMSMGALGVATIIWIIRVHNIVETKKIQNLIILSNKMTSHSHTTE